MEFTKRKLDGVREIQLKPKRDERGYFMRTFDVALFENVGLNRPWVQENQSRSERRGIVRGLHFQFPPHTETKLVRCIRGAIWDVFVDLRRHSSTFGNWDALELSEANQKMIYIPRGFAHGFCTLTEESEVQYKVDSCYNSDAEAGLLWSDADLALPWPVAVPILSDKDTRNMTLRQFIDSYGSLEA